jgi:hypothetical protein
LPVLKAILKKKQISFNNFLLKKQGDRISASPFHSSIIRLGWTSGGTAFVDKIALFAFNGDPMCFIHVLLNAQDLSSKDYEIKLVIEGSATRLIPELGKDDHPLHGLYEKVKQEVLLVGACKACSQKMGTLQAAEAQGLHILEDMSGHPSMESFIEQGYRIITF